MHVISGKITKDVFKKTGGNSDESWYMYAVELSEQVKEKDGSKSYTNYSAVFFARTQNAINFYNEVFVKDNFVVISASKIKVKETVSNSNGQTYVTLDLVDPKLVNFFKSEQAISTNQNQGNHQNNYQQQTQNQNVHQQRQNNNQYTNFDDDIPF